MEKEEMNTRDINNPEQQNDNDPFRRYRQPYPANNWLAGFVVIIIGIVLLLGRIPQTAAYFPGWLFDWPMILVAIGIFSGAKHGYRNHFFWLIPVLVGIYFTLNNQHIIGDRLDLYAFPILLIFAGFFILIRRNKGRRCDGRFNRNHMRHYERMQHRQQHWEQHGNYANKYAQFTDKSNEDYIDINSVFGHSEKAMFTKTFKGGNISSTFGGSELNLSQADIEETAVLNITVTFGGVEITVPANWTIQNELTTFMGGIEDKRRMSAPTVPPKILILRGNIFCGGVEIKN